MLAAVTRNTGQTPQVALAEAGCRSGALLAQLSAGPTEVIVALGRESKKQASIDADKRPHTAVMAAKLQSAEGRAKYHKCKAILETFYRADSWPNMWTSTSAALRAPVWPSACAPCLRDGRGA